MINALPSSNSASPNAGGSPMPADVPKTPVAAPPPTMPGFTHDPGDTTVAPPAVSPAATPHQPTSGYAESLSKKIHGNTDAIASSADTTVSPIVTTPTSTLPDKSMDSPPPAKKRFSPKAMITALVLGLAIVGGGAGYYLTQQNQDVRQQAASEEVTGTETARTPTEWGIFNQQWNDFISDSNNDWASYVTQSQTPAGARYQCDVPIMTVGEETLYGCDLNALFVVYETEAYIQPSAISPQDPKLNTVLDALITNSGLLQEAQKRGLITLDETIYNSSTKDPVKRIDTLRELRETIGNSFDKTVDYEAVVIYFHNQIDPKIPLAEAQTAAKAKMDVLYSRLQNGEITMEQAGAEIAADSIQGDTTGVSLANLDNLYKENAYSFRNGHSFNSEFFTDPSLNEELRSLGEGQMSTVRLCKDSKFTDAEFYEAMQNGVTPEWPVVDSCYIIFKVNKIDFGWMGEGAETSSGEDFLHQTYSSQTDTMTENFKQ